MQPAIEIKKRFEEVFDKKQAVVLAEVIHDAYSDLVKTGDFNELKEIVKNIGIKVGDLAEAQKRTEGRVSDLAEAQKRTEGRVSELAEAQKRTEGRVSELAEAQKRTELKVAELADDMKVLAKGLDETREEVKATRGDVGGLSRSVGYAFENEAYRMLPSVLKEKYGIELKEKLIRAGIGGKEINIFGRAKKDGKDILIVGEATLRLDDRRREKGDRLRDLEEKVKAVAEEYEGQEIIRVLITHYATKGFLRKAKEKGVIVVQSFEW
jgi:hypothetical protein